MEILHNEKFHDSCKSPTAVMILMDWMCSSEGRCKTCIKNSDGETTQNT